MTTNGIVHMNILKKIFFNVLKIFAIKKFTYNFQYCKYIREKKIMIHLVNIFFNLSYNKLSKNLNQTLVIKTIILS